MSNPIDDFWNELAITQMVAGGAPSVVTKDMRKALDGDKEAADKISSEIDVEQAAKEGVLHRQKEICQTLNNI